MKRGRPNQSPRRPWALVNLRGPTDYPPGATLVCETQEPEAQTQEPETQEPPCSRP